ncbi:MAG: flagellar hook-associated protein FlgK [Verrucomicrobiae bacterium]|nr:flagellar hook-associated protein FlgK [Verrucomicrobiae bacterium]
MLGLFGTLDLARRAMQAQMAGVTVAGQNLANVNTPGYSRQRVDLATSPDLPSYIGQTGTGVNATGITQIVSNLLNGQIQSQSSTSGFWTSQQTALQSAQDGLAEFLNGTGSTTDTTGSASSSGLSGQLSNLFAAFQGVAASPGSIPARQTLIGAAQNLATMFNQVDKQLTNVKTSLNTSLSSDVDSANKVASQIADLNKQISIAEFSGGTANDLRDQREQALEKLSGLANITTSTGTDGSVNVSVGGQALVSGRQVLDTLQTYDAGGGQMLVRTAAGGTPLTLTGGTMQGTIEARDGELGTMQTNINSLATNLINGVNAIYQPGYGLNGTTGATFFDGTGAGDMAVNQSLVNDPSTLQAANAATATGDNSVALQLAQLADTAQAGLNNQTFGDYYGATVTGLGSALSNANTEVTNQQAVSSMLSTQLGSVSGVNIDEEMTNLLSFQRAYTASAELLKTVDQMIQTTLAMKT